MGLLQLGKCLRRRFSDDSCCNEKHRFPHNAFPAALAGQRPDGKIDRRDLKHPEDSIDKTKHDRLVDVVTFIPGKLPDFLKCL